jgi:DNA-binding CsgD family transcriptional regulator
VTKAAHSGSPSASVPDSAYRSVLALTNLLHQCTTLAQLEIVLTENVATVIPADLVTLNKIDINGNMGGSIGYFSPEFISPKLIEPAFDTYVHQHPLVQDMVKVGDTGPRRMSDFISVEEFKKLELYEHVFKPLRSLHQIGFSVVAVPGMIIGIGVNRTHDDFSDEELALARLLWEQIPAAFHHVQLKEIHERESKLGASFDLSGRESELLVYLRAGLTNQAIAESMILGRRTVEKHLQNLYAKLAVTNRTAAVNVVWPPQSPLDPPVAPT